jgi:DNA-binding NtrC family response regulator
VTASILCIDDEPAVGVILEHTLNRAGHRPVLVSSVDEAMRVIARTPVDLIIADYRMPGLTGLDLLAQLQKEGYRIPVIIMTGYSSIEHAVMSIKSGAIDYLTKPIQAETLEIAVRQALEVVRLRRENETFRREIVKIRGRRTLIGDSEAFCRAMEVVGTVAASRVTVLLQGESGTGKELFARAIHDQSPRADEPFITVNCAALPEGLVESALFGHEKGAFTGATVRSAGAFERAHGGTLLLDEISEMRLDLQSKLLRVIQEQEFERVGGHQPIQVDVRLIATTNRDLKAEVDAGRFRGDLYYRLNVVPIRTPSLRERLEDIPRLVHHFVTRSAELHGGAPPTIAPETLEILQRYPWPGNVRELANSVERAVILSRGSVLQPTDFDQQIRDAAAHPARPAIVSDAGTAGSADAIDYNLDAIERLAIERALAATGGNRTRAARLLGISERTLRNKLNTPRAASGG